VWEGGTCRRRQYKRDVGTATAQIPADCPGLLIYGRIKEELA